MVSTAPKSASLASDRLADEIPRRSAGLNSLILRSSFFAQRLPVARRPPTAPAPCVERASGERSSCDALANSDFCEANKASRACTNASKRCAAWLKRAGQERRFVVSIDQGGARPSAPSPQASALACKFSKACV
jgi:hypothetical protein